MLCYYIQGGPRTGQLRLRITHESNRLIPYAGNFLHTDTHVVNFEGLINFCLDVKNLGVYESNCRQIDVLPPVIGTFETAPYPGSFIAPVDGEVRFYLRRLTGVLPVGVTAVADFGDGTPSVTIVNFDVSCNFFHFYRRPGEYDILIKLAKRQLRSDVHAHVSVYQPIKKLECKPSKGYVVASQGLEVTVTVIAMGDFTLEATGNGLTTPTRQLIHG